MKAILSAKIPDPDDLPESELVIFRPISSLCNPYPDRKTWVTLDVFFGKRVLISRNLSRGAGGQYRLVPYNSIFCSSDRSIGNRADSYGKGD
jgi:hypothetical protein